MIRNLQLLFFSRNPNCKCNGHPSYCTKTLSSTTSDTLFKRILPAGDPNLSIIPILNQWVQEGRLVDQSELKVMINLLRKCKRYSHALQLADWMSYKRLSILSPGDVAVRLDLISKTCGIEEAEHYFNDIPDNLRTMKVFGSLLNCYAYKKLLEKAEVVMQKMREMGYNATLSYNVMLNLYSKLGKHKKLEKLVQEMEVKGISFAWPTFYILLNAYAASSNIEALEKLLLKMENDLLLTKDWHAYVIAGKGYLRAGMKEKTSEMLKKAEKRIRGKGRWHAYDILLSMYATLGNSDAVHRIWHFQKKRGNPSNVSYFHMISSLIRLDDIDGAQKILDEWESINTSYDWRIPNTLINAYTKKGMMSNAEAFITRAIAARKKVPASTWDHLATGYYKNNQMEKAVETMKRALVSCEATTWKLNHDTLTACLKYLKEKGDAEKEEFERLLAEQGIILQKFTNLNKNRRSEDVIFDESEWSDDELDWIPLHSKDLNNR